MANMTTSRSSRFTLHSVVILILTATLTFAVADWNFHHRLSLARARSLSLSLHLSLSLSQSLSQSRKQAFHGVIAVPKFKPATVTTGNLCWNGQVPTHYVG